MKTSLKFISDSYSSQIEFGLFESFKKTVFTNECAQILIQAKKTSSFVKLQLPDMSDYQKEKLSSKESLLLFEGSKGPVCAVCLWKLKSKEIDLNTGSDYSNARDLMGRALRLIISSKIKKVNVVFDGLSSSQRLGILVGLEMALYTYKSALNSCLMFDKITVSQSKGKILSSEIKKASSIASAVNLSRHLVNLPPNELHPKSFSGFIQSHFQKEKNFKVTVWDKDRLKKENMNLLLAVGEAAKHGPALVHVRYRGTGASKKPIAIVGKGITFDSGGLNLKPSQFIRIMKKDMGGSASTLGLAHWVKMIKPKRNFDFYFALAENAISGPAFRPGDIFTSRSGQTVEIDNTDAEGRLVLADAIDVAVSQSLKPSLLIDLATLTGSTRVGVGAEIAGLYCDNKKLSSDIVKSSFKSGDLAWPLPLYKKYFSPMKSDFADFANAASGYGGGIRAALFLQKFVKDIPWAHFDFHAWVMSSQGAFTEPGGNGQVVQCLIDYLDC